MEYDLLYSEHATCFFTLKQHDQAALGIGINFTKDARLVHCEPFAMN